MHAVSQLVVRVADLCEAEGRLLRENTVRVALGLATMLVAALTIAGGMALVLGAMYWAIAERAGRPVAALVTGVVAMGVGGALLWLGRRIGKCQ